MKFRFIKDHRSLFSVIKMCHHLSVSKSGFYDWFTRPVSKRIAENNKIYMVNHRKLLNIIQFFYEWSKGQEEYYLMDMNKAFLLASSVRLFDSEYMKPLDLELSSEFEEAF